MTKAITTGQAIKNKLDEIGWSVIDLHRATNINISTLEAIIKDEYRWETNQMLNIINKINLKQPPAKHWDTYHEIMVAPVLKPVFKPIVMGDTNDTK